MPLGSIAGGIFQLTGGADPELPRRNIPREVSDWNNAMPRVLRGQAAYNPQFAALMQQQQADQLLGTAGGFQDVPIYTWRTEPEWIQGPGGDGIFNRIPNPRAGQRTLVVQQQPVQTPAQRGILNLLQDVQPGLRAARAAGDVEGMSLLDLLTRDAEGLINRGSNPLDERETVQSIRGAQSARGLAHGPGNALAEVLGLDRSRDSRRIQRGQYGSGILALRRGYMGDPTSDALRLLGLGDLSGARGFTNPFNAYGADVANTNYGAGAYEEIAKVNNRVQGIQNVGSGVSSLAMLGFGGGFGGMGGAMGGGGGGGVAGATNYLQRGQYF